MKQRPPPETGAFQQQQENAREVTNVRHRVDDKVNEVATFYFSLQTEAAGTFTNNS